MSALGLARRLRKRLEQSPANLGGGSWLRMVAEAQERTPEHRSWSHAPQAADARPVCAFGLGSAVGGRLDAYPSRDSGEFSNPPSGASKYSGSCAHTARAHRTGQPDRVPLLSAFPTSRVQARAL